MEGLMQKWPLNCARVIEHAARQHAKRRIVTRTVEGPLVVTDYARVHERALRFSKQLVAEGIKAGDRVGTLAVSTANHLECWYGIAGIGAVYHAANPRLFPEQIIYTINHAQDRMLFIDSTFVDVVEKMAPSLTSIERYVVLCSRAQMPSTKLRNVVAYEDWLAQGDADFAWPSFDENAAAAVTYTSGTTGQPKGVVLSHRSIILMGLTANSPDMYGFSANDVIFQLVPMCHANGWTWPFSAPMAGAGLIYPGNKLDGPSIAELLVNEHVTITGAVPSVWTVVLDYLKSKGQVLTDLKRVIIGGSPASRALLDAFKVHPNVEVRTGYGMTEMGPIGSCYSPMPETRNLPEDEVRKLQQSQGRPPFMVEYKIVDDEGKPQPWDGQHPGNLRVRGPCIIRNYYQSGKDSVLDDEGFFDSGDIAVIDANGYVKMTDRAKDLVKSGGEWISSIDLENAAMGHPAIFEAAVIAAKHPKWDERPLLVVVLRKGEKASKDDILEFLKTKVAKWWLPDDVVFVDALPHTATGKLAKAELRKQFADYKLPGT